MRTKWKAANHYISPEPPPMSAASCGGFQPLGATLSKIVEGLRETHQRNKVEVTDREEECPSPRLIALGGGVHDQKQNYSITKVARLTVEEVHRKHVRQENRHDRDDKQFGQSELSLGYFLGHAAPACSGTARNISSLISVPVACAASIIGIHHSCGILPRSFQPWTVDTATDFSGVDNRFAVLVNPPSLLMMMNSAGLMLSTLRVNRLIYAYVRNLRKYVNVENVNALCVS